MIDTNETIPQSVLNDFYNCGKYGVIRIIGNGAFGKVFLVSLANNSQKYAAKLVTKPTSGEENIWPKLRHPNILPLTRIDRFNNEAAVFLMPYVGHDLFYMLYEQEPDFHQDKSCFVRKRRYTLDVLRGLEFMHRRGICHLDIREENILIQNVTDTAVIGDFSTVNFADNVYLISFGLHQLSLPPEAMSEGTVSFDGIAAEMWTFGILVLQVFTKQYLTRNFKNEQSYDDVLPKILSATKEEKVVTDFHQLHSSAEPSSVCKSDLFEFIDGFLVINPEDRNSANKALQHPFMDLDRALSKQWDTTYENSMLYKLKSLSLNAQEHSGKRDRALYKMNCHIESVKNNTNACRNSTTPFTERVITTKSNSLARFSSLPFDLTIQTINDQAFSIGQEKPILQAAIKGNKYSKRNKNPEKSAHTMRNFDPMTNKHDDVIEESVIGDHLPPPKKKWANVFRKLRPRKLNTAKIRDADDCQGQSSTHLLLGNNADPNESETLTAKPNTKSKPWHSKLRIRYWYWNLRKFGRMLLNRRLFRKRRLKNV